MTPVVQPKVNSEVEIDPIAVLVPRGGERDRGEATVEIDGAGGLPGAAIGGPLFERVEEGRPGLRRIVARVFRNDVGDPILDERGHRWTGAQIPHLGVKVRIDE
jgi:hypothetical protein